MSTTLHDLEAMSPAAPGPRSLLTALRQMFAPPRPFASREVEGAFIAEYSRRFAPHRRAAIILAFTTWVSYFGWDYVHATHDAKFAGVATVVVALRVFGGIVLAASFVAARGKWFENERYATWFICSVAVLNYALHLLILRNVPLSFSYHIFYLIGLALIMAFTFCLLRLFSRPVFIVISTCLFLSFLFLPLGVVDQALLYFDDIQSAAMFGGEGRVRLLREGSANIYYYLSALNYLSAFGVIGCVVSSELERTARSAFVRERQLESAGEELARKNLELESLNIALSESERETQRRAAALVAMKEELRDLAEQRNLDKSKFLADAAHDLSQPLQSLAGYLTVAATCVARQEAEAATEALGSAQQALQLSLTSFHNILEISRIETGYAQPTYSRFDVQVLLDEVMASFAPLAEAKGVTLKRRRGAPLFVRSDYHHLQRVIANLVSNAVKYSDPAKPRRVVLVAAVRLSGRVRIDVLDNGLGIPAEKFEAIFKPFVQLHNNERNRDKGVGLGLSIVSAIVGMLEGHRVDMSSTVGAGARFSLEVSRGDVVDGEEIAVPAAKALSERGLEGLYLLYVEDDLRVRESTAALLELWGGCFDLFTSYDDLAARLPGMERVPDVIVTDYRLPGGFTAVDVAAAVAAEFQEPIPMLVMTGEVTDFGAEPWLAGGKVLRKPIKSDQLRREILGLGAVS
jgi:signal transduction histidine kinase/CheY-like chemotaxis protein